MSARKREVTITVNNNGLGKTWHIREYNYITYDSCNYYSRLKETDESLPEVRSPLLTQEYRIASNPIILELKLQQETTAF